MKIPGWTSLLVVMLPFVVCDVIQNATIGRMIDKDQQQAANIQSLHADLRKLLRELEIDQTPPELLPTPEPEADLFDSPDSET